MMDDPIQRAVAREQQHGAHISLGPPYKFAKQLLTYRKAKRWAAAKLAQQANRVGSNITAANIEGWETGETFPTEGDIRLLAALLAPRVEELEVADYWIYLVADARDFLTEPLNSTDPSSRKAESLEGDTNAT